MREIEFRGKSILRDESWQYGDLEHGERIAKENPLSVCQFQTLINGCAVKPDTVGEFSGITDDNSVKIFEDDIVKKTSKGYGDLDFIGKVVFHEGAFKIAIPNEYTPGYYYIGFEKQKKMHEGNALILTKHSFFVIGNIHDNPDIQLGCFSRKKADVKKGTE